MTGATLNDAQRFTLKDTQGAEFKLDDALAKNKAVLLNFWATWCGYCVEEMPDLIKLHAQYKDKGFTVVGVNAGESAEAAERFMAKQGVNFPVVLDEEMTVSNAYNVVGIPTTILLSSSGQVLGEYHSFTKKLQADVAKALES
jgi:peroxiredoxin